MNTVRPHDTTPLTLLDLYNASPVPQYVVLRARLVFRSSNLIRLVARHSSTPKADSEELIDIYAAPSSSRH